MDVRMSEAPVVAADMAQAGGRNPDALPGAGESLLAVLHSKPPVSVLSEGAE